MSDDDLLIPKPTAANEALRVVALGPHIAAGGDRALAAAHCMRRRVWFVSDLAGRQRFCEASPNQLRTPFSWKCRHPSLTRPARRFPWSRRDRRRSWSWKPSRST